MKGQGFRISAVVIALVAMACVQQVAVDTKSPRMTKEELMTILDRPDVVIIDVRIEQDWKASDRKIKGAIREDPETDIKMWASKYQKDSTLVFY